MKNCLSSFLINCHQRRKVKIIVWHWQDRPHTSFNLEINWNRNRTRTEPFNQNSFRRSTREYWMICGGGQAFSPSYDWATPPPPSLPSASCLSFSPYVSPAELIRERVGGGEGAKLIAGEKAWSSYTAAIHYSLIVTVFRWTLKFNRVFRFYQTSVEKYM